MSWNNLKIRNYYLNNSELTNLAVWGFNIEVKDFE